MNYNKQQAERDLKKYFGVTKVIFIEGIPDGDLTKGHIDGIARFIGLRTVVVVQCTTQSLCQPGSKDAEIYDKAAKIIEEAGFSVIREPIEGFVKHNGQMFDTNYMKLASWKRICNRTWFWKSGYRYPSKISYRKLFSKSRCASN